jgi:hypothetical protein
MICGETTLLLLSETSKILLLRELWSSWWAIRVAGTATAIEHSAVDER